MFAKGCMSGPQALFCVGTSFEEIPSQQEESDEYFIKNRQNSKCHWFWNGKPQSLKDEKTIEKRKITSNLKIKMATVEGGLGERRVGRS